MGGNGHKGDIALQDVEGRQTMHLDGGNGNINLGGGGSQGDIALKDEDGNQSMHIDGETGEITANGVKLCETIKDFTARIEKLEG